MILRLTSPELPFWVDVQLRSFGGRWMAVADIAGDKELGLGTDPRQAVSAAVRPAGVTVAGALLKSFDPRSVVTDADGETAR